MIRAPYFKIETFGAVDGPGVRLVLFLQGCNLRCKYCHNPESWDMRTDVNTISPQEVMEKYNRNRSFYKNGGITVSGGEPLLHFDFCLELAELCHEAGISLALDTSGSTFDSVPLEKWKEMILSKPLWLIDIKHINPSKHQALTSSPKQTEIALIKFLEENNQDYWVRQVLVPGWTDDPEDLQTLGKFLSSLKHMIKFELLPYHKMALSKYVNLGLEYPLKDVPEPSPEHLKSCVKIIRDLMHKK